MDLASNISNAIIQVVVSQYVKVGRHILAFLLPHIHEDAMQLQLNCNLNIV